MLGSVVANESDVALKPSLYVGEAPLASGVKFLWPVSTVSLLLVIKREGLKDFGSDIFLRRKAIALVACSSVVLCSLALLGYIMLRKKRGRRWQDGLAEAFFWCFSLLGQQIDMSLLEGGGGRASSHTSTQGFRALLLLSLTASMLCLHIYQAQLASEITARRQQELTLDSLRADGHDHVLYLRKEQKDFMDQNRTNKIPDAWLLTKSEVSTGRAK